MLTGTSPLAAPLPQQQPKADIEDKNSMAEPDRNSSQPPDGTIDPTAEGTDDEDFYIPLDDTHSRVNDDGYHTAQDNSDHGDPSTMQSNGGSDVGQGELLFPIGYPEPRQPGIDDYNPPYAMDERQRTLPLGHGLDFDPTGTVGHEEQQLLRDRHDDGDTNEDGMHPSSRRSGIAACCCLWDPLMDCCRTFSEAENLHKSLCFGAIDGMLTGSGIVSTCFGLGLLPPTFSPVAFGSVVALSWAACTSDALCMALGHLRNASVVAWQATHERKTERKAFDENRAMAKGQLVDLLLSKGMLKMDAVSLVDTLEGYPEIFCSMLCGESIQDAPTEVTTTPNAATAAAMRSRSSTSYGSLYHPEYMDLDEYLVEQQEKSAGQEGIFMMIGFSLFGTIPAVVFAYVAHMVSPTGQSNSSSSTAHATAATIGTTATSILSILMALLGVWKR